jgi:hypothetical protein
MRWSFSAALAATVAALLTAAPMPGEAQSRATAAAAYSAPRTPWGDPDLQGTYTNSNESGIPMARPAEFAGRRPEDVTPAEMQRLARERAARIEKTAQIIGATEDNNTGAGPTHWYENYNPKNSRPWMVLDPPDYQVPPTTQEARDRAAALRAARGGGDGYYVGPFRGPEEFTPYVRCITRGVPGSMMPAIYGNAYDITQSPGFVAIRYEMVHETRVIRLEPPTASVSARAESRGGNRQNTSSALQSYTGYARGRWEGDTLVIETTNYREAAAYGGASSSLKTTERFTPTGPDTIEWSIRLEDAHTWTRPWSFGMRLTRDAQSQVFEYACHEGNEGMRNMLKVAREAEKREGR